MTSPAAVTGVTAQYSLDNGATWRQATVTGAGGAWTLAFGAPAGSYVSLKVSAADAAGGKLTETVIRAFATQTAVAAARETAAQRAAELVRPAGAHAAPASAAAASLTSAGLPAAGTAPGKPRQAQAHQAQAHQAQARPGTGRPVPRPAPARRSASCCSRLSPPRARPAPRAPPPRRGSRPAGARRTSSTPTGCPSAAAPGRRSRSSRPSTRRSSRPTSTTTGVNTGLDPARPPTAASARWARPARRSTCRPPACCPAGTWRRRSTSTWSPPPARPAASWWSRRTGRPSTSCPPR